MKLPEINPDLKGFEKHAKISVPVIAKIKGSTHCTIGKYTHSINEWQIDGYHGQWDVDEWWPLPEFGTGNS